MCLLQLVLHLAAQGDLNVLLFQVRGVPDGLEDVAVVVRPDLSGTAGVA